MPQFSAASEIKSITVTKSETQLTVLIVVDKGSPYESYTILNPNRLVMDFTDTKKYQPNPS